MANPKENSKLRLIRDEESTDTDTGGRSGTVEFHDFLTGQPSAEEVKRLLSVHKDINGSIVEKQKQLRDQIKDFKEGKTNVNQSGLGGQSMSSEFQSHPILSQSAQLDGIDPQVNLDPRLHHDDAEPNSDKKQELTYKQQLELHPEMKLQNQFTPPKPSPL